MAIGLESRNTVQFYGRQPLFSGHDFYLVPAPVAFGLAPLLFKAGGYLMCSRAPDILLKGLFSPWRQGSGARAG